MASRHAVASPNEWSEWSQWLAAGLHARNRWRLPVLLMGILFAHGRRTVTTWLRAAGVSDDYQDYYYFLAALGRKTKSVATQLFSWCCSDCPWPAPVAGHRRLAHQAVRAQGRRGRHPSQSHARPGRPEVSVRTHLGHAVAGPAASAVGRVGLAAAGHAVRSPTNDVHDPEVAWLAVCDQARTGGPTGRMDHAAAQRGGKTRVDRRRWRLHEASFSETSVGHGSDRGRPTAQGRRSAQHGFPASRRSRPSAQVRQKQDQLGQTCRTSRGWQTLECTLYGQTVTKIYKTFLATYPPAGGVIRVVIVEEDHGWYPFFWTDPNATVEEIIEAFADRATIEQDFHDVKEVWGAGQQQVRNIWTNVAVYHLNLWMHTLVELWAWDQKHEELCDRTDSPWDDADRRPSHADRRKALRRSIMRNELSAVTVAWRLPRKIIKLAEHLMNLAS